MERTVLRGAYALQGPRFQFERRPLDVLVEGERITAIEPAGAIPGADAVIDLSRHLNVSLGTDGSCSTVTANMLQVVGAAAALSKLRGDDYGTWLTAADALRAATQGGARALGFGDELGVIAPGARADVAAYRLDTVTFTPLSEPVRQLVYTERGAGLDFAMVAGDVVMRDGRLTRVDEPGLLAELASEWRVLEPRFAAAEASVAPVREAIDVIYRRALATEIPADTYPARWTS
jgi:guanine deaminase